MNVFITGASSGIGAALAREFARRGASLGLVARRQEMLDQLSRELGGNCRTYAVDVTDREALIAAAREFDASSGGADIVIANAGISVGVYTEEREDLEVFDRVMATNVTAILNTFHAFIQPMRRRGNGTLVGVASVAGVRGLPGAEAYSASKAAAINYCESLRSRLRGSGIRVLTLAPGFIRTPLTQRNPYAMPFLMDVEPFAERAADAILRGRTFIVIPWQMAWIARVLRVLPDRLLDRIFAGRPHKPRSGQARGEGV